MSDVEQSEITAQPAASEEQDQTLEFQGQSEEQAIEENPSAIPQKFLEASKIDVINSYRELEKERGRLANELGSLRKSQEDMAERFKQLEAERLQQQSQPQPVYQAQQEQEQQELDPVSVFESKFDEDPRAAIREGLRTYGELTKKELQKIRQQELAAKASEFYYQQKQTNPDFARREPLMQQLAQQYGHIIRPEYLNSAEAIRVLDLLSKGADVSYYEKSAVENTKKHRASIVEEKRRAQSESATSEGDSMVDLGSLSNEEYLKHVESLYGRKQD